MSAFIYHREQEFVLSPESLTVFHTRREELEEVYQAKKFHLRTALILSNYMWLFDHNLTQYDKCPTVSSSGCPPEYAVGTTEQSMPFATPIATAITEGLTFYS